MTVVIFAREADAPVDAVVRRLAELGVPVFRANTSWFPGRLVLDAEQTSGQWVGELCDSVSGRRVDLGEVRSIWYRDPTAFRLDPALNPEERRFAYAEARLGFGGVLSALPVLWMNHPNRAADSMYKPLQLTVAAECGLRVPRTLVTNDPDRIRAFAAESTHGAVQKTFGANTVTEGGQLKVSFTHRLAVADLADLRGAELTCQQVQDWVPKAHDARVVVIGEHVFAVSIFSSTPTGYLDWRSDYDSLSYEIARMPDTVEGGLRAYLRRLGLTYAAFDFVVDHGGSWWFLESNSAGQYGWLEAQTGLPMTEALAGTLAKGAPSA